MKSEGGPVLPSPMPRGRIKPHESSGRLEKIADKCRPDRGFAALQETGCPDAGQEGHPSSVCLSDPWGRELCGHRVVPGIPNHS